jgi:hypothetical protein
MKLGTAIRSISRHRNRGIADLAGILPSYNMTTQMAPHVQQSVYQGTASAVLFVGR